MRASLDDLAIQHERKVCCNSSSSSFSGFFSPGQIPISVSDITHGRSCKIHKILPGGSDTGDVLANNFFIFVTLILYMFLCSFDFFILICDLKDE